MNRIKCTVSYDGTSFSGFQVQPNSRTVQGEIEKVLHRMHKGNSTRIYASGRTDATVHAVGQVFHFDSPLEIPLEAWKKALNTQLPDDIVITQVEQVDESFHARFSAKSKEYRYRIVTNEVSPFLRNFAYHYPYPLHVEKIKLAMPAICGTHDFTSFCSAKTEIEDHIRTIDEFELIELDGELQFRIKGNGFLYNMVRIIVGTMLDIGSGKIDPNEITEILDAKDRTKAGKTAPGHGLYLWKVNY